MLPDRHHHADRRLKTLYPLAAVAGQRKMVTALLLLAVDPRLGGVLLTGEKGAAKSTAVRALMDLLPAIEAVSDCPFHCHPDRLEAMCPTCRRRFQLNDPLPRQWAPTPFLTLPLGATEDRLVGGLDFEQAAFSGRVGLSPGLLGQANRGFLYVDEVNLLEPYLAHLLLDAAETGVLRVEREGLSLTHPARIALVGSMNPEEGPLGPQLADRFALTVRVKGEADPGVRREVVQRRLAYEADPAGFRAQWAEATQEMASGIVSARKRLPRIGLTDAARRLGREFIADSGAKSHRSDLALNRAAIALAAWQGDEAADESHVTAAAEMALESRRPRPRPAPSVEVRVVQGKPGSTQHYEKPYLPPGSPKMTDAKPAEAGDNAPRVERRFQANESFEIVTPVNRRELGPKERSGRRAARKTDAARGRRYRTSPRRLGRPLALDATLRAAAPHQAERRAGSSSALVVKSRDFMEKVFRQKTGRLVLFVVDASGSVGSLYRMSEAKAAAMSLLSEAYRKRDRVGLIAFHNAQASVLLPPTNSVEMASRLLQDLPTGGKTPLAAALVKTHNLVRMETAKDPSLTPLIVVMTDGRPNVPLTPGVDPWPEALRLAKTMAGDRRLRFLLVDTDRGHYNDYKLTRDLAASLNAPRLTLEDLREGRLTEWLERM